MLSNNLSKIKVLVVDDERTMVELVRDLLTAFGFKDIVVAHSGQDAINLLNKQQFDFIITDWRMDDLDGIDLVRFIRRSPKNTFLTTPVLMLTGNTEAEDVIRARDAGVSAYLIKPFTAEQLVKRIRTIIENPRQFVISGRFTGPDRRHTNKAAPYGEERRHSRNKQSLDKEKDLDDRRH